MPLCDQCRERPPLLHAAYAAPAGELAYAPWGQPAWMASVPVLIQPVAFGYGAGPGLAPQGAGDQMATRLDTLLTAIDRGAFSGGEEELARMLEGPAEPPRGGGWEAPREAARAGQVEEASTKDKSTLLAKVELYANARLPANLPPLRLYLPSYPLICLAAQFSEQVYQRPQGKERETHVDADWRLGTKAMVIKSVPVDHRSSIVFAIRGTHSFKDWAVNLNSAPASPLGFLDDPGNLCHAGFLNVARKMARPVAARLSALLQEDSSRSACSLVMTGHSAGGAVASLLFAHMLSRGVSSELTEMAGRFKRIHCITFGAPPVSLLPITKPDDARFRKSLFLSIINEGDPVARADKPYVRSLIDLWTSPPPRVPKPTVQAPGKNKPNGPLQRLKLAKARPAAPQVAIVQPAPVWPVPPCTLSNAGRVVVLRPKTKGDEDSVVALTTTDAGLRGVVFGDPLMHVMKVYRRRAEILATKAVTGGAWGQS